ncbi:MAG: hypothetical protein AAF433_14220 [Bacteroidota bacterium]
MKRIQLFEFEDFSWLPASIRAGITRLIVVFLRLMKTPQLLSDLIRQVGQQQQFDQIVDLGSGAGGAMPEVIQTLNAENPDQPLKLLMTDLHPNPRVVAHFNNGGNGHILYSDQSTDATDFSRVPAGLKTMVNSFHHLPPEAARSVLRTAQTEGEPLLIYELAENKIPLLLWWLLLPISMSILVIMVWLMTPFVRPLGWKQLLFTYLIPVIPLVYAWDGQASLVRIYTKADVQEMIGQVPDNYHWTIEPAINAKGKKAGYYILGLPR